MEKYKPLNEIKVLVKQYPQKKYHTNFATLFSKSPEAWGDNYFVHISLLHKNITDEYKLTGFTGANNAKDFDSHWTLDTKLHRILYGITEKDIAK